VSRDSARYVDVAKKNKKTRCKREVLETFQNRFRNTMPINPCQHTAIKNIVVLE